MVVVVRGQDGGSWGMDVGMRGMKMAGLTDAGDKMRKIYGGEGLKEFGPGSRWAEAENAVDKSGAALVWFGGRGAWGQPNFSIPREPSTTTGQSIHRTWLRGPPTPAASALSTIDCLSLVAERNVYDVMDASHLRHRQPSPPFRQCQTSD